LHVDLDLLRVHVAIEFKSLGLGLAVIHSLSSDQLQSLQTARGPYLQGQLFVKLVPAALCIVMYSHSPCSAPARR